MERRFINPEILAAAMEEKKSAPNTPDRAEEPARRIKLGVRKSPEFTSAPGTQLLDDNYRDGIFTEAIVDSYRIETENRLVRISPEQVLNTPYAKAVKKGMDDWIKEAEELQKNGKLIPVSAKRRYAELATRYNKIVEMASKLKRK